MVLPYNTRPLLTLELEPLRLHPPDSSAALTFDALSLPVTGLEEPTIMVLTLVENKASACGGFV